MKPHIRVETEISLSEHDDIGDVISVHGVVWTRILAVGVFTGHVDRIKDNTIASNCSAPPLYGLRKDHKAHDDEVP